MHIYRRFFEENRDENSKIAQTKILKGASKIRFPLGLYIIIVKVEPKRTMIFEWLSLLFCLEMPTHPEFSEAYFRKTKLECRHIIQKARKYLLIVLLIL